ncbi:MAG TPA: cysteine--tRNA ligase [Actinomycetota bacterium]|nr:cysteine--tRNA ligase [Actinomycetota bacterium]
MRLTNTLDGTTSLFEPASPPRVGIYVCGPTVYDVPHVGHARAAVVFDVLRRHLTWRGYDVLFVRNITDVEDKIINRANSDGVHPAVIAERYTRVYDDAMRALGVLDPDIAPRASGHIPEMVEMIGRLVERGHAYEGEGSVWFSVESFVGYGKLSGRTIDVMLNQERVEPAPGKAHPLDFALWKAAKPGEPSWGSPWGPGRPGWHIECSAMTVRYLGMPFDIHGGGADLIFPHHENEIAQAEAALGHEPLARWWLHNGHVQISGEKMSKSLRNFVQVDAVLEEYAPQVLRMFFMSSHYRSQINYTLEALEEARAVWDRFAAFLRTGPLGAEDETLLDAFGEAMDDDLNTPAAIASLHALVSEGNRALGEGDEGRAATVRASVAAALDLLGCEPEAPVHGEEVLAPLVQLLLEQREHARAAKDFNRADEIRDRLAEAGVKVEDSAEGPRWFVE